MEKMMDSELLFELHSRDGHVWRLYANGVVEGFPEDVIVLNSAWSLLNSLRCLAREKQLPGTCVTSDKTEPKD